MQKARQKQLQAITATIVIITLVMAPMLLIVIEALLKTLKA